MGRSWFYLTLWRGTPPEFTEEMEIVVNDVDRKTAIIQTSNTAESKIATAVSAVANIISREIIGADISTTTEVLWYVG